MEGQYLRLDIPRLMPYLHKQLEHYKPSKFAFNMHAVGQVVGCMHLCRILHDIDREGIGFDALH